LLKSLFVRHCDPANPDPAETHTCFVLCSGSPRLHPYTPAVRCEFTLPNRVQFDLKSLNISLEQI